ncbi:VOC family protein [Synechocystis sp. PCC 7509]|uniref:VOC family protein n=1 Tax=Synechocystis sp. PCC 7509 TaxID=927677 RepID=UPI0002AC2770|nr:VOC family protein [Synechocystis sp. PCC 7509]
MALTGINHIVLKVKDLEASDYFYREILGMRQVGKRDKMWFYSAGNHHHDLALVEVGNPTTVPQMPQTGLFHLCFNVSDESALAELHDRTKTFGVTILGAVDHTIMRSFYVLDPDRHVIELGVDIPQAEWAHLSDPFGRDVAYSLDN